MKIKRNRPLINFTIDAELLRKFNLFCKNNCINKSKLIEMLIKTWIENGGKSKNNL